MSGNNLELYPAMDLREGRVVRLYQGDYSRQTTFAAAPQDLARRWQARGVRRVHVVDLDGARHGRAHNLDVMTSLAALGLRLQCGGGRSEEHTSELQSRGHLVCRLLLEKKKPNTHQTEDTGLDHHQHKARSRQRQTMKAP